MTETEVSNDRLFPRAVEHTRGLALAQALWAVIVGFTADDLELLRFPGFLAGLILAFFLLTAGSLLHGYLLTRRLREREDDRIDVALRSARSRGRFLAVLSGLAFVVWLVFYTQGVPPWAL